MEYRLRNDLIRRDGEIVQFYYKSIGLIIKKRRKKLNYTQEYLAKGICSNTYISKIENNQIEVNRESLMLIMEKMDLPKNSVSFPEDMVRYLEKSILLFFYKDLDEYKKLFDEIDKFECGVLIEVCRIGYYVLTEQYKKARIIHNEIYQYLNSMENFGFSVFLLYSAFYNIGIGDYKQAKLILESFKDIKQSNEMILGLCSYAKFLLYGHINLFNYSRDALSTAQQIFNSYENIRRIEDIMVWKKVFSIYEGISTKVKFVNHNFDSSLAYERNTYLLINLISDKDSNESIKYFDKNNWLYLAGCYFVAKRHLLNNKIDEYNYYKNEINSKHYINASPIDFVIMLKLLEQKLEMRFKDYLVNVVLPYVNKIQNIYFMNLVTKKIATILSNKNRYKDSLSYIRKNEAKIASIQNYHIEKSSSSL